MATNVTANVANSEELVNIEWKAYGEALRVGLWKLFAEKLLVDVSLTECAGLKVHKFVLATFFGGMSKELMSKLNLQSFDKDEDSNSRTKVYEIGFEDLFGTASVDWDVDVVRQLFEFTYSGRLTMPADNVSKVLCLAEAVGFDGLVDTIREYLDGTNRPIKKVVIEDGECIDHSNEDNALCHDHQYVVANHVRAKPRRSSRKGTPKKLTYVPQLRTKASTPCEPGLGEEKKSDHNAVRVTRKKAIPVKRQRKVAATKEVSSVEDSEESLPEDPDDPQIEQEESSWQGSDDEEEEFDRSKRKQVASRKRTVGAGRKRATTEKMKTVNKKKKPDGMKKRKKKRIKLMCDQCEYSTADRVTYENHLAKHDPTLDVQRFECNVCSKTFRSGNGFKCHIKTHGAPTEQFQCTQCPFTTPQKWSWRQHMAVIHKLDAESGRELIANFHCDKCDFECVAGHQLKAHLIRKHSLEKPFKCVECPYETTFRSQLEKHISVSHRKERPYMCETCGFRSQTQNGLTRHKRGHLGIKPFKCLECGKEYADRGKYKAHLQRHTGDEKPFVCHICAHSCRRRDNLRMHFKRIHHLSLDNANVIQSSSGERGLEILAMTAGDIVTLQPTSPTYDPPMMMMNVGLTPSNAF